MSSHQSLPRPAGRWSLGFLAVGAVPLLAGCALFPLGGQATAGPGGRPSAMRPSLREYRVVFHCHSFLSHDSEGRLEEIAAAARGLGIDAVLLTDHATERYLSRAPRGVTGGVLMIPGLELRARGFGGASVMALGPGEEVEDDLDLETRLAELRAKGAVVVAGHVEEIPPHVSLEGFQGFEVYNLHAQFTQASVLGIGLRLAFSTADGFFERSITTPAENLARWDRELAAGRRLFAVAGCDAHANVHVLGATIGTYPEVFRLFSNRVLAPEPTEAALMEGLARGRLYVTFDYLADATGFVARYGPVGGAGGRHAIVGEAAPFSPWSLLEVQVPREALLRVIREGEVVVERRCRALAVPLDGPGAYRVEAYLGGRLWIAASPIYLEGPRS